MASLTSSNQNCSLGFSQCNSCEKEIHGIQIGKDVKQHNCLCRKSNRMYQKAMRIGEFNKVARYKIHITNQLYIHINAKNKKLKLKNNAI